MLFPRSSHDCLLLIVQALRKAFLATSLKGHVNPTHSLSHPFSFVLFFCIYYSENLFLYYLLTVCVPHLVVSSVGKGLVYVFPAISAVPGTVPGT